MASQKEERPEAGGCLLVGLIYLVKLQTTEKPYLKQNSEIIRGMAPPQLSSDFHEHMQTGTRTHPQPHTNLHIETHHMHCAYHG